MTEEYNIKEELNALYTQQPSMNWSCRFGIHRWSLWTDIQERKDYLTVNWFWIQRFQRRSCVKCRKIQENIIR